MKPNRHIISCFLLLLAINISAQSQYEQKGNNNQMNIDNRITYNGLSKTELLREMNRQQIEFKRFIVERDSISSAKLDNDKRARAQEDSITKQIIEQKEADYQHLSEQNKIKEEEYLTKIHVLDSLLKKRETNLFRNYNLAPIGIKQFNNNKNGQGWAFLSSQIVVPAALGIGFGVAAKDNYKKHKYQKGQMLIEHKNFYDKYKTYRCAAIVTPIIAATILYGLNVWCNYQCANKNMVRITPQTGFNFQGDFNMGLTVSINF